ncbi:hypothetical protein OG21DRAFT_318508 [Imleria badia]|nr:hypothetical protein OG21DRAFT_318508 [Imleria badia]
MLFHLLLALTITNQSRARSIKPWLKAHLNTTKGADAPSIRVLFPRWKWTSFRGPGCGDASSLPHIHVYVHHPWISQDSDVLVPRVSSGHIVRVCVVSAMIANATSFESCLIIYILGMMHHVVVCWGGVRFGARLKHGSDLFHPLLVVR